MDPLGAPVEIAPTDPQVLPLIESHLQLMYASSPACSVHAMRPDDIAGAGVRFFAIFEANKPVAMGALKRLGGAAGEIKSMHVRAGHRGRGLADRVLLQLLDVARADGMGRVYLETGSQSAFAPARAFYARHGFGFCAPFADYADDPASVFMRLGLDPVRQTPQERTSAVP